MSPSPQQGVSRRQLLTSSAIALPPLLATAAMGRAIPQLGHFRVNCMPLVIPQLPAKLNGLRIAQVSDTHVGRYTRPGVLERVVETVNALNPDLIVFTGDLIDYSLDDLPRGIRALQQLRARLGLFMIEGNHDLIQNPDEFDSRCLEAGLKLLTNQSAMLETSGVRLQILGTRWGASSGDRRKTSQAAFAESIQQLTTQRDPDAFPILLAHHPHAFDPATRQAFPLTLSGHTHGGQLMLSPTAGFGPLFYRYWSGLYRKNNCQLVVSNGIGNWFPLRINAPAELNLITLVSPN